MNSRRPVNSDGPAILSIYDCSPKHASRLPDAGARACRGLPLETTYQAPRTAAAESSWSGNPTSRIPRQGKFDCFAHGLGDLYVPNANQARLFISCRPTRTRVGELLCPFLTP